MIAIVYDPKSDGTKQMAQDLAALVQESHACSVAPLGSHAEFKIAVIGRSTDSSFVVDCYANGQAVIASDFQVTEDFVSDLCDGYLVRDGMWYAKIFPSPVIVTDYRNLRMGLGATINPRAIILNGGIDGRGGHVSLGRGTHIGADGLLNLGCSSFTAGNFTLISANFSAHAMKHTTSHISNFAIRKGAFDFLGSVYEEAAPITVGHDVWVGERVTCLQGVKLGDGCVIGAGSIVTKSTEPYGIYAGNPARLIRYRFDEEKIRVLRDSEWWHFPYKKLYALRQEFERPITDFPADVLKGILS